MRVFHTTTDAAAAAIERDGFRDGVGSYLTVNEYRGVWLGDLPMDPNEGASGDVLFVLDIPEQVLKPFEWIEEGKPYREFLVPADTVNEYPRTRCDLWEYLDTEAEG